MCEGGSCDSETRARVGMATAYFCKMRSISTNMTGFVAVGACVFGIAASIPAVLTCATDRAMYPLKMFMFMPFSLFLQHGRLSY